MWKRALEVSVFILNSFSQKKINIAQYLKMRFCQENVHNICGLFNNTARAPSTIHRSPIVIFTDTSGAIDTSIHRKERGDSPSTREILLPDWLNIFRWWFCQF
jgi:hypothetical protein